MCKEWMSIEYRMARRVFMVKVSGGVGTMAIWTPPLTFTLYQPLHLLSPWTPFWPYDTQYSSILCTCPNHLNITNPSTYFHLVPKPPLTHNFDLGPQGNVVGTTEVRLNGWCEGGLAQQKNYGRGYASMRERSERVESPGTYVTKRVSNGHFCLALYSLGRPSVLWWLSPGDGWDRGMPLHDVVWIKGHKYWI